MNQPQDHDVLTVPERGKPVRCLQCGYALTHAPVEGECPECGRLYSVRQLILSVAGDAKPQTPLGWLITYWTLVVIGGTVLVLGGGCLCLIGLLVLGAL